MYRLGSQLGTRNYRSPSGHRPTNVQAGSYEQPKPRQSCTPAHDSDVTVRLLRLLIERFGGEATSGALIKHTALEREAMRLGETSASLLRAILGGLADRGAITLEDLDEGDVIVRIARGAVLIYQ